MSEPRHKRLTDQLRGEIVSGRWSVGDRLPPEVELAAARGVSRATLRRVLSALEAEGLIARRKRLGTLIASRTPVKTFRMVTGSVEEVLSLGRETRFEVVGCRHVANGSDPLLEGRDSPTGFWLEVTGKRFLPDQDRPFNWSRIFVSGRYAGVEPALCGPLGAVYQAIETTFGLSVVRVNQSVGALACPTVAAGVMGLTPGAPATVIDAELFASDGTLVEASHAIFDPARFRIRTDVWLD